ncbi:tRNA(fMet)-specific endonuclease VapC [Aquamicrobium terrae]
MIGIDTNVLVRLVAPDDQRQNEMARVFFAGRTVNDPAFVSSIVLAETVWLLRRHLGYSRAAVENLVRNLLASDDFVLEHGDRLAVLLDEAASARSQLADHLIAWSAERMGCTATVTFDKVAARRVPSMELLS